jgi:MFS family permease
MDSELKRLLHNRAFVWFLGSRWLGGISNQMLLVALAWNMYDLTHSAWDLGLVGLFQFVPVLLMTLPAGQAADRWNRVRIFMACGIVQWLAAMVAGLAVHWHADGRELILALSVLLGVARAFQMPAQQALLPSLVSGPLLPRAIALSSGAMQVGIIGGPALGGALYAIDAGLNYDVCALLSALAVFAVWGMPRMTTPAPTHHASWGEALAGLAYVWRHKVLLGSVSLDMFAVLFGGATALLPIFAKDLLNIGPVGLGLLRAAPAVGALIMSLALSRWPIQRHIGRKLHLAVALFGVATVAFGLSEQFWLSWLALVATGAADNVSVVIRSTVVQIETPDDMRGRVSAINSLFIGASNQLGEFESGAVAEWGGPVFSVVSGGLGTIVVSALWWRWFPRLAHRDRFH